MGRGCNRRTLKMRKKKAQAKNKARLDRRKAGEKAPARG
jgi:hypothetical protein